MVAREFQEPAHDLIEGDDALLYLPAGGLGSGVHLGR
jgi:hypothetical protein